MNHYASMCTASCVLKPELKPSFQLRFYLTQVFFIPNSCVFFYLTHVFCLTRVCCVTLLMCFSVVELQFCEIEVTISVHVTISFCFDFYFFANQICDIAKLICSLRPTSFSCL